jgi:hypothetical protein
MNEADTSRLEIYLPILHSHCSFYFQKLMKRSGSLEASNCLSSQTKQTKLEHRLSSRVKTVPCSSPGRSNSSQDIECPLNSLAIVRCKITVPRYLSFLENFPAAGSAAKKLKSDGRTNGKAKTICYDGVGWSRRAMMHGTCACSPASGARRLLNSGVA